MGCTITTPKVDGEEFLPTGTPSQPGFVRRQIISSPQHGSIVISDRAELLDRRVEEDIFLPRSPSFRHYIRKEDTEVDVEDIISSICKQRSQNNGANANKSENSHHKDEASRSPKEIQGKEQKKERGWMSKVLNKRTSNTTHSPIKA